MGERPCHLGNEDDAGYGCMNHGRKEARHAHHKEIHGKGRIGSEQSGRRSSVKGPERPADCEHGEKYSPGAPEPKHSAVNSIFPEKRRKMPAGDVPP